MISEGYISVTKQNKSVEVFVSAPKIIVIVGDREGCPAHNRNANAQKADLHKIGIGRGPCRFASNI
jgi:hypothetical protein